MTEDDGSPIFERGDVVLGADPFKGDVAARPWVIVSNHEGRPFHGEQYIALTLTTRSWLDGLVEIPEAMWLEGGTPAESRIVPWGVQSLHRDDLEHWQGRLDHAVVDEAVALLVEELEGERAQSDRYSASRLDCSVARQLLRAACRDVYPVELGVIVHSVDDRIPGTGSYLA